MSQRWFSYSYVKDDDKSPPEICGRVTAMKAKAASMKISSIVLKEKRKDKCIFRINEVIFQGEKILEHKFHGIYVGYRDKLDEPVEVQVGSTVISYSYADKTKKITSKENLKEEEQREYDLLMIERNKN